jgi:hypothetical protein
MAAAKSGQRSANAERMVAMPKSASQGSCLAIPDIGACAQLYGGARGAGHVAGSHAGEESW